MKKNLILYFILLSLISLLLMNCKKISENEEWRPKKPINLIVPWPAGEATDRISRMLASALEPCLEDKIIINNQPAPQVLSEQKYAWMPKMTVIHQSRRCKRSWKLQSKRFS